MFNKIIIVATTLFISVSCYAKTDSFPVYPKVNLHSGVASPEIIKKGEYLAKMGDCLGCHTNKATDQAYAGGYQFPTPFGVLVSPNITPDKATGIGTWTEKEFARAVRNGIRQNGKYLYPAMPYNYFHQISEKDTAALYAYFMSIPAIHNKVRNDQMMWPFNWRFLQLGWRILFFNHWNKLPVLKYEKDKSAQWNRGRYIVEGLGHCNVCHGPMGPLGNPKMKYKLTGNMILGFYAPNITASRLKNVPVQKIVDVFKKNKMLSGGPVQGPMLEANEDSFKWLSDKDLRAIAVYLKTLDIPSPPHKHTGPIAPAKLYSQYCAQCHTTGGSGAPMLGDKAEWNKRLRENGGLKGLQHIAWIGKSSMPPKGTCISCSRQEIDSAVEYILKTTAKSKGISARKATAAPTVKYAKKKAQQIYQQHCAACHSNTQDKAAPQLGDIKAWHPILKQQLDVLFSHAIYGHGKMPAAKIRQINGKVVKGYCPSCTDEEIEQAVIYMADKSNNRENYSLW